MSDDDNTLGMNRPISRRDFVDGMAVGVGGAFALPYLPDMQDPAYPPALTGLRGSHPGSFEALHQLRDGAFWQKAPPATDTGEEYDLIVVGGGISGLTAAWHFRRARPGARVLILENHDDFGGHARRNEFSAPGRMVLGYGGTQSIDSPAPYSAVSRELLAALGVSVGRWEDVNHPETYQGLGRGFFFDRETFGRDQLVAGYSRRFRDAFLDRAPVTDSVRKACRRLRDEPLDPWPGETSAQKKARLARLSYADFVTKVWGLDPGVLPMFGGSTFGLFGVGIDAVPAQDAFALGFPGFQGMKLDPTTGGPGQNLDTVPYPGQPDHYFHFPDGNASVARLLVRQLIPSAIPGRTMDDVVTARAEYSMLDRAGSEVRIRLSSSVMRVRHLGDPQRAATRVEVTYSHDGTLHRVAGRLAVLACWHSVIPYLCPELPEAQRKAMALAVKVPLVYTNVLIRNWRAFQQLGVRSVTTPGMWHMSMELDFPVSIGGYRHARTPDEPVVVHMSNALASPGLLIHDQHRAGRAALLATDFETIERSIRNQLARVLGPGGFDSARDILAITVNRWPHGYAYQYNSLFDDFWRDGGEQPCEVARRPFGRIAIANSDAGAYAYTDSAIDQGFRAVQDLLAL